MAKKIMCDWDDELEAQFYCINQQGEIQGSYCSIKHFEIWHNEDSQYKLKAKHFYFDKNDETAHKLIQIKDLDLFKKKINLPSTIIQNEIHGVNGE